MRMAIIKYSDLAVSNRWDAGFHLSRLQVRDREDELRRTITADEARERLARIGISDKKCLLPLCRTTRDLNSRNIEAVEKEYPHLALALIEQELSESIRRTQREIASKQAYLQMLLSLESEASTWKA